jgi:hypothetical protein
MSTNGKPTGVNEAKQRAEEIAVCNKLAELLGQRAGCTVHIEAVNGFAYRRGGAMSLKTMQVLIERLTQTTGAK